MLANWPAAFDELLGNEGGFVDNPADPGGATRYGVTQRVARAHGYTGDMRDFPESLARQIAKAEYWDKIGGDSLPAPLDFQAFDAAYNSGVGRAAEWLQQALGVTVDGDVGPETLSAAHGKNPYAVACGFNGIRLAFLAGLEVEWHAFGREWSNRIAHNLMLAAKGMP